MALRFLEASESLHGVVPDTLVFDRIVFLPLSLIESSDKTTLRFLQELNGVPVEGGGVNLLMDSAEGYLLSVYSNAMPVAETFDTEPSLPAETAQALAAQQLLLDTGVAAEETSRAELLITRIDDEVSRTSLLTWLVKATAWRDGEGLPPISFHYWIDAGTGEFVRTRDAVKHYDVSGSVVSYVTQGAEALHTNSPVESKPMSRIHIYDQAGTQLLATAAEDGTFTIPTLNAPLPVTVRYEGEKASRIENDAGGEYTWNGTLNSPTGNVIKMNATPTEQVTAQANAYLWITRMYDWILATNPADSIWSHFDSTGQPGSCQRF